MNISTAALAIALPTPSAPHTDAPSQPDHAQKPKQPDFQKTLHDQLGHGLPVLPPSPHPHAPDFVPSDEEEAVSAADGAQSVGDRPQRPALPFVPMLRPPLSAIAQPEPKPAKAPLKQEAPQTVHVLVEPSLPPVQPAHAKEPEKASLVDFPQLIAGHVQQAVHDNRPVTQLDFQITPPQVGPVNLQFSLQNGALNIQLVALTTQAQLMLESKVNAIQSILQSHNLAAGEIKVVTAASGKGGAGGAGAKGDQPGFGFFNGGKRRTANEDGTASSL
ncbi:MAG TPA: flagellar hook-length control protein FliK [Oscillatoriaceae cyanobacterium]